MRNSKKILLLVIALLPACAVKPTRFVYRADGSDVFYLSKESVPFKATIHGFNWHVQQEKENTVVLSRVSPYPVVINIYEYNENRYDRKFFKSGFTEAQSLKEYTDTELRFYQKKGASPQILKENLDGVLRPNAMWSFSTSSGGKVYNISAAKNDHLITFSYQSNAPSAPEDLKEIFKSVELLSKDEAAKEIGQIEDKHGD